MGINYKSGTPVTTPVPKWERDNIGNNQNAPRRGKPEIAPKPKLMYVYQDANGPTSYQAGTHDAARASQQTPTAAIISQSVNETNGRSSTADCRPAELRIPEFMKDADKGYKILADVGKTEDFRYVHNIAPRSKGGKMFQKQKKRMEEFTSEPSEGMLQDTNNLMPMDTNPPARCWSSFDGRGTPWNLAKLSHAGVNYIPTSMYNNALSKHQKIKKGSMLAPLATPPPEWRAKVESNFSLQNDDNYPVASRRWNINDALYLPQQRAESAPPVRVQHAPYVNNILDRYTNTLNDRRNINGSSSVYRPNSMPVATIRFNARAYRIDPHRQQGAAEQFTTTPFVYYDFNAIAVGWGY